MYTSKYCCEELNGGKMTWSYVVGEVKELIESRTKDEVLEEISDVIYSTACALYDTFKINLPIIGGGKTIEKIEFRINKWIEIFNQNNLKFDKKYLVNGSNYLKAEKIEKALELAKIDQGV